MIDHLLVLENVLASIPKVQDVVGPFLPFLNGDNMALSIAFSVFVIVVLVSGYVSLGSLVSAAVLPAVLLYTAGPASPMFLVSVALAAFVFWTHRANIGRLRRGEEHRFGKRAAG